MRWVRTAATTITSVSGAAIVLVAALTWFIEPRLTEWADSFVSKATKKLEEDIEAQGARLERFESSLNALSSSVESVAQAVREDGSPSWRFSLPDTRIEDGSIGGTVQISSAGYKLKECGIPVVDLYFVDMRGVFHRFVDASVLSIDNRGIALPVDPRALRQIRYTAQIPANDEVTPGRAEGFISITYPDKCPRAPAAVAGPLQFRISKDRDG